MRHLGARRLAGALTVGLTAAIAAAAQAPQQGAGADGFIHAELTLDAQPISVAFRPDLPAVGGTHLGLLSGAVGSRARVGSLTAHRALRMGSIAPDLDAPPPDAEDEASAVSRELWLARTAQGWELEAHAAGSLDPDIIPLTQRATDATAPTFTASLHATAAETGRLVLRWGAHVWSTDFRFDELPPRPQPQPTAGSSGTARERDTDTTPIFRRNALDERNETALVLPGGGRINVLYWKNVDVEDEDYPTLTSTADGAVVELIRAPVLRLRSDVALRVGGADLPTGNLAPGFAGSYGIWLRRAGDGWQFVFNNEPDSWGTQHDATYDVAAADVYYSRSDGAFRPLGVTLALAGGGRGRLIVHWGPHEWAADFTVVD
jgi:hypothetical protein